ncbi:hypothetical protein BDV95DRAFT_611275 [Massariosphaeria phaeospora]|uniref:Uncharacterized protein n=1 Tax=Massariosphaeria phaeospora TaxID=100035 RepID=A0A7C8I050_9PLEO|nr:hypothetical protein BDV95DRAFT_611275 [Massariosphaeria phaeospora]
MQSIFARRFTSKALEKSPAKPKSSPNPDSPHELLLNCVATLITSTIAQYFILRPQFITQSDLSEIHSRLEKFESELDKFGSELAKTSSELKKLKKRIPTINETDSAIISCASSDDPLDAPPAAVLKSPPENAFGHCLDSDSDSWTHRRGTR